MSRDKSDGWSRGLYVLFGLIALATVAAVVVLFPTSSPQSAFPGPAFEEDRFPGRIVASREAAIQDEFLLPGAVAVVVDVELEDGRVLTLDAVDDSGIFTVGRRVEVSQVSAPGSEELFAIVDLPRGGPLIILGLLFVAAVLALGRWQGFRALLGLVLSAGLIVGFLIPAVLTGGNPTLLAMVTAIAVMMVTLPLSHGLSRPIVAAAIGTALALGLTVVLAMVAVEITGLTGLASEDVQFVRFATGQPIDLRGLLLAGMIVGTLGVLDDVTVSQASTVAALRRADPTMTARTVFVEALAVGRDHIAATVNTLFLAYAGAALPLLILFVIGGAPVVETLTSELVAQEVVRTLVGSIGLIAAVPVTTALAAVALGDHEEVGGHEHAVLPSPSPGEPPVSGSMDPAAPDEFSAAEASLRRLYGLDKPDRDDPDIPAEDG